MFSGTSRVLWMMAYSVFPITQTQSTSREVFIAWLFHEGGSRQTLLWPHRFRHMLRSSELFWGFTLLKCGTPKLCRAWDLLCYIVFPQSFTGLFPKKAWCLRQWGMFSGRTLRLLDHSLKRSRQSLCFHVCADRFNIKLLFCLFLIELIPEFHNTTLEHLLLFIVLVDIVYFTVKICKKK